MSLVPIIGLTVPRKKSAKKAAQQFIQLTEQLEDYCTRIDSASITDQDRTWAYEAAIIKLSAGFERLMLQLLIAAVNIDPSALSSHAGVAFPKHMTDEVCEYLITGGGYFDFRGRDGLIKTITRHVGSGHYLLVTIKKAAYRDSIERLLALRNFAAHESAQSKKVAKEQVRVNLSAAGSWLKRQQRFNKLAVKLRSLAADIEKTAPY